MTIVALPDKNRSICAAARDIANSEYSSAPPCPHRKSSLRACFAAQLLDRWYAPRISPRRDPITLALSIISRLYGWLQKRDMQRSLRHSKRLPAYVISVGNLVAGGTGKTPLTIWLAQYLSHLGLQVAVLSRGYGRKNKNIGRVPQSGRRVPPADQYGDEPVLLSQKLESVPVWVARQRWRAGVKAIESDKAEILLLDDGFQHYSLHRDLDLVLLDSGNPFGNGSLLPLGALREPIEHLDRADALILTRAHGSVEENETRRTIQTMFPDKPIFCCNHVLSGFRFGLTGTAIPLERLRGRRTVAFTGIAQPDSFFASIDAAGIAIAQQFTFPDHYHYTSKDLLYLLRSLTATRADLLLTTEKDAVRLPREIQACALTAQLELDFGDDRRRLSDFLRNKLNVNL